MPDSQGECRAALRRIVDSCLDEINGLQQTLQDEREALERQGIDALGAAAEGKQQRVANLQKIEEERRAAVGAAGQPSEPTNMPAILAWCGADERTIDHWQRFRVLAADCDRLNSANGAIIHLRRRQFMAALAIVSGSRAGTIDTYGPSGGEEATRSSRALAQI